MLFCFPLIVAIQEISARMCRTTGRGIARTAHEKAVLFSGARTSRPAEHDASWTKA
jgi:hypothetical protein